MTTVKELIEILERQENQGAEIFIAESQYEWHNVLHIMDDSSNPDDTHEIQV